MGDPKPLSRGFLTVIVTIFGDFSELDRNTLMGFFSSGDRAVFSM